MFGGRRFVIGADIRQSEGPGHCGTECRARHLRGGVCAGQLQRAAAQVAYTDMQAVRHGRLKNRFRRFGGCAVDQGRLECALQPRHSDCARRGRGETRGERESGRPAIVIDTDSDAAAQAGDAVQARPPAD